MWSGRKAESSTSDVGVGGTDLAQEDEASYAGRPVSSKCSVRYGCDESYGCYTGTYCTMHDLRERPVLQHAFSSLSDIAQSSAFAFHFHPACTNSAI